MTTYRSTPAETALAERGTASDERRTPPERATSSTLPGWKRTGLWVLQVGLAAMFMMAGGSKLAGAPDMIALFEAVGLGQWFRYVTGALEVLGAVLLLVPALAGVGAAILAVVLAGALLAHLFVIGGSSAVPALLLAAAATVVLGRREQTVTLMRR